MLRNIPAPPHPDLAFGKLMSGQDWGGDRTLDCGELWHLWAEALEVRQAPMGHDLSPVGSPSGNVYRTAVRVLFSLLFSSLTWDP